MKPTNRFSQEHKDWVAAAPARRLEAIKLLLATLKKRDHVVKGGNQKGMSHWRSFAISVDGVEVDISCKQMTTGDLRFIVGDYDRSKAKNQFPEPRAGFDFARIAEAVEAWVKYLADRKRRRAEEEARDDAAQRAMRRLAKSFPPLKSYLDNIHFDTAGRFKVDLRCETIDQVERVLLAALEAKVES